MNSADSDDGAQGSVLELALRMGGLGVWWLDLSTRELSASERCKANFGVPAEDPFSYEQFQSAIHPVDRASHQEELLRAVRGRSGFDGEYRCFTPAGDVRWIAIAGHFEERAPGSPRIVGISQDISDRRMAEAVSTCQKEALELAVAGAPLPRILKVLVTAIEGQTAAAAAIYVVDSASGRLRCGASSMPDAFNRLLDDMEIGPDSPIPARVVHTREAEIVEDLGSDPAWQDHHETARKHGVCGCWSFPLLSAAGEALGSLSIYQSRPRVPDGRDLELVNLVAYTAALMIERAGVAGERARSERVLGESETRLRHILDSAKEYAIITLAPDRSITSWNSGAENLLGYAEEEALGLSGDIFFTPEDRARDEPGREMRTARTEGRANDERWHMRKDGSRFWGSGVMLPLEDGQPGTYLKIFRDQTEEREAAEHRELLLNELQHRVKNTLTVVQAMASQSLRDATSPEDGIEAFNARLLALANAHDVLISEKWGGADLAELVTTTVSVHAGTSERFAIDGPEVRLTSRMTVSMALALHELATNAAKYGALSVPEGRVEIGWKVRGEDAGRRLRLSWSESGGPPVRQPTRKGFGSRMIERALSRDLRAEVTMDYAASGLVCTIDAPLPEVDPRDVPFGRQPAPQAHR